MTRSLCFLLFLRQSPLLEPDPYIGKSRSLAPHFTTSMYRTNSSSGSTAKHVPMPMMLTLKPVMI